MYTSPDPPCSEGVIRLAGGRERTEGRVEVCSNGVFGTVCDRGNWDSRDATVVCRQLRYQHGSETCLELHILSTRVLEGMTCILYGEVSQVTQCSYDHYHLAMNNTLIQLAMKWLFIMLKMSLFCLGLKGKG